MFSSMKTPDGSTRVNGIRTRGMDEVMKFFLQATFTKVNTRMERRLVRELTIGLMVRYMMGNGFQESNRDMAFGKGSKTSHILANGWKTKHRDMEFTLGGMETSMKENGRLTSDMEMVLTFLLMVTATAVCTCLENQKGSGNIDGQMAQSIRESSKMD